jgi:hypothetical protein
MRERNWVGRAPVDRNLMADGTLLRRALTAAKIATEPPASRQNIVARPDRPAGRRTREGGHKEGDGWMDGWMDGWTMKEKREKRRKDRGRMGNQRAMWWREAQGRGVGVGIPATGIRKEAATGTE